MLVDASQVVGEEIPLVGLEKVGEVAADTVLAAIAERLRGGWVDGENRAGEIVGADQAKAVVDQLAIALLAVVQRNAGLLPCRSHPGQRRRSRRSPAFAVVSAAPQSAVLSRHWLKRKQQL